jgi:hypothetical protein
MACPQSTRRMDFVGIAEPPRSIPERDFAGHLCAQVTGRVCLARPRMVKKLVLIAALRQKSLLCAR